MPGVVRRVLAGDRGYVDLCGVLRGEADVSERHQIALLTALIRVVIPTLDGDAAAMQAIAMARGGIGEREITELLDAAMAGWKQPACGWFRPTAGDILAEVDFALAVGGDLGDKQA